MLVFETKAYLKTVDALGPEVAESLQARLERLTLEDARRLPKHNGLRIIEARGSQILGDFVPVEETTVFCALTAHRIDSPQQTAMLGAGSKQAQRLLEGLPSDDELRAFVEDQLADLELATPTILPDDLYNWLIPPSVDLLASEGSDQGGGTTTVVFETPEWADALATPHMQTFSRYIYDLVIRAADHEPGSHFDEELGLEFLKGPGCAIAFRWFDSVAPARRRVLVLLRAYAPEPEHEELMHLGSDVCQAVGVDDDWCPEIPTTDAVARLTRRTYPAFLLADEELWLSLERQPGLSAEQGLALSVEEVDLLFKAGTDASLPLFINGRAGSGKSTMLAYLFAAYWHHRLTTNDSVALRFLATNKQLLDSATSTVENLLKNRAGAAHELGETDLKEIRDSFIPFREFVLSLLPARSRSRFEDPRREIRFAEFARLVKGHRATDNTAHPRYQAQALHKTIQVSAETAWYVIRTFIKGYGDDELSASGYDAIPSKDRVISREDFTHVVTEIWEPWYRQLTTDDGFWDDQDLAREALRGLTDPFHDSAHPEVAVMFCDEAQDFTRLELQMLLRCSVFSKFDLSHGSSHALPFAFAGDPLQTINPTGFRWERMQDAFHEEIVVALGLGSSVKLQPTEFATNYRSEGKIVDVLNAINMVRRDRFGLSGLSPQASWSRSGLHAPPWEYVIGRDVQAVDLLTHLGQKPIVLVPWDVGNKLEHVTQDELLAQLFPDVREDAPPQNLLTAVEAKGLQFPVVILYKFGEACPEGAFDLTRDEGDTLPSEFFFNKLYVAASRAQTRLIVIDTAEGHERLWKPLEEFVEEAMASHAPADEPWLHAIRSLVPGEPSAIVELADDINHRELAHRFRTEAELTESPNLWRLAAQNYRTAGEIQAAETAEAWADFHDANYSRAAEQFWRQGEWDGAWRASWAAFDWPTLSRWYREAPPSVADRKQAWRSLVGFLAAPDDSVVALEAFLTDVLAQFPDSIPFGLSLQLEWRQGVAEVLDRMQHMGSKLDAEHIDFAFQLFDRLERARFPRVASVGAQLAFEVEQWEWAATLWERADETSSRDYLLAKARSIGFPAGLVWLRRRPAAFAAELQDEWVRAGSPSTRAWMDLLAPILERQRRWADAARGYLAIERPHDALRALRAWNGDLEGRPSVEVVDQVVDMLFQVGQQAGDQGEIGLIGDLTNGRRLALDMLLGNRVGTAIRTARAGAVIGLALRDELSDAERRALEPLVRATSRSGNWRDLIDPMVMGVALERGESGLVAILTFYEDLQRRRGPDEQTARERWLVTKLRQVEWADERIEEIDRELRTVKDENAKARAGSRRKRFVDDKDRYERSLAENENAWRLRAGTLHGPDAFARSLRTTRLPRSERFDIEPFSEHSVVRITDRRSPSSWQVDLRGRKVDGESLTVGAWGQVAGLFQVRILDERGTKLEFQDLTTECRVESVDLGAG